MHYICRMMRLLSLIIVFGVILQACSKQVIFMDYLLNKNYIAKVLCENKSAPSKHCFGKCHLKKELEKDTQRQDTNDQKVKTGAEIVLSLNTHNKIILTTSLIREIFYRNDFNLDNGYNHAVFHPPSC